MPSPSSVERLSSLIESAAAVVGEVDLDHVLRRLISEARSATGAQYAALGLLGPHGVLSDFLHEGLDADAVEKIGHPPRGRGVLGTVVREQKTIVVNDIASHPDSYGFPDGHPAMKTFLGVPLRSGQSAYGNLYLTGKEGGFTESDVALVEALAVIAGSAVNTHRLRDRLRAMAIVEDRDRIARDLHDSIIQDLFAIGLSLQGLSERQADDASSAILDSAVDRLDETVETLRSYIYELRSSDNIRRGFHERIEDLVERMAGAYPTTIVLDSNATLDVVDPRLSEEMLKLVTEALSNALRHAAADMINVTAALDEGFFSVVVADDGIGFDRANISHGLGLINMSDRTHRLKGQFDVDSSPGEGTVVTIGIPTS